jgi:hypothetical protein
MAGAWVTWMDAGDVQLQGLLHTAWWAGVVAVHSAGQRWGQRGETG